MKLPWKKISLLVSLFGVLLFAPKAAWASTLSLSPSSTSTTVGLILQIQVVLNTTGESINAVQANINYPSDKFDIAWINASGSAFSIEAEQTASGGLIKISRGALPPGVTSTSANVATIGLKGKAAGSGTLSFASGSAAARYSDSSNSLTSSSGGTYSVTAAPNPPPPSPPGQPPAPPAPVPGKDTTAPVATGMTSADASQSGLTISWNTDEKADSLVEYGFEDGKYYYQVYSGDLLTSHSVRITKSLTTPVVPGETIHYIIKSKDSSGNQFESTDQSARLKGYKVKVRLTNNFGLPLSGVEVVLFSEPRSATTDLGGEATFEDVSPGKHSVSVKDLKSGKGTEITVAEKDGTQSFNVTTEKLTGTTVFGLSPLYFGAVILVILLASVVLIRVARRRVDRSSGNIPPSSLS